MPNWTKEQQEAIDKEGKNIIVSAGAGSGKTAVLTARVIRKLKDGIDVNRLLVLTFTNEAAGEMKDRIRKAIKKEESLSKQLDYLDSAYITTFDSYALSIVKKYHYLLNISKNIGIVSSSIINIKKQEELDQIFEDLYNEENKDFLKLINDFCLKDDKDIKKQILNINNSLEQKYNKQEYLKSYIEDFYNETYINNIIQEYLKEIKETHRKIKNLYEEILTKEEDKKANEYIEALSKLINSKTYDEIKKNIEVKLPRIVKNTKEEREKINELLKDLKNLTKYRSEQELKETYLSTKTYVKVIIDIIEKLDQKINSYKQENSSYEFIDISKMAINIVKENKEVRDEIKYYYNEIMVDEYQDTNDLQEIFINQIENNNVYMVGDIKQSIYRFRNANPTIFKNKYNTYNKGEKGIKIDLLKNFRSRSEVLEDINKMFNKIMDNFLGGADYKKTHQMIFGNLMYEKQNKKEINNNLEIYNYNPQDIKDYNKNEIEAFIIAQDIKNKINNNYMVIDKETGILRQVTPKDFCIIMDRGSEFDLYKKIFEYEKIPLLALQDEKLTTSYDIFIIKNIANLIIKIKQNKQDKEFKYFYTSIKRSFLYNESDSTIIETFKNNTFKETELYQKAKEIAQNLDNISCHEFLTRIIKDFDFYKKSLTYHDIDKTLIRIANLMQISSSLEDLKYTPYDFAKYLTEMIESDEEIKYKTNTKDNISVKIMNIHKSKGLEFPVCYYSGLYKTFNIRDITEKFKYDNKYGIMTPYYKEGVGTLFTQNLMKKEYMQEEISEKIRLLYVAVTRAKEKMIFVSPLNEDIYNDEQLVNSDTRLKYKSFLDIINTVKDEFDINIKNIDQEEMNLSKDYNLFKSKNLKNLTDKVEKVKHKSIEIPNDPITESKFSKINTKLKTKEELENMQYGTYIHYLFETEDFLISENHHIKKLLKHDLFQNIKQAKIIKEHEFFYEQESSTYHGIIDLMLEYENNIDIIDYKLSDINDQNYKKQLKGYKDYIEAKTHKKAKTYLYSISQDLIKEIN